MFDVNVNGTMYPVSGVTVSEGLALLTGDGETGRFSITLSVDALGDLNEAVIRDLMRGAEEGEDADED